MDKKALYAIVVVAILVVASVGAYVVMKKDKDDGKGTVLDDAELKVFGNVNGDRYIDSKDVNLLKDLVKDGKKAEDYPLADANQDGKLDQSDVDLIQNVIDGKSAKIYHVNYHDTNKDGVMDQEIVSTALPIKAAITTLSANTAMLLYCLGLTDEIVGATYSTSSIDTSLYSDTFLNTDKTVRLGTNSGSITFEDGKAGSSDVIKEKGVTAVISDWNRTYITNESDFEAAGIDVVRVAAAAIDKETMTHSALLLGLLFGCSDRAEKYLDLSLDVLNHVADKLKGTSSALAVASSMTGYLSSPGSDYTQLVEIAGGSNPLPSSIFGTSTSAKIADHPEVYNTEFNYIIHIRTALNYGQDTEQLKSNWETYTAAFSDWKYSDSGQYMISGAIPVALRIAYAAAAMHSDVITSSSIDDYHQKFVDQFYDDKDYKISEMTFLVTPGTFSS